MSDVKLTELADRFLRMSREADEVRKNAESFDHHFSAAAAQAASDAYRQASIILRVEAEAAGRRALQGDGHPGDIGETGA